MAARNRPSSVDRLPEEVRQLIADLRQRQGLTLDEILDHLRKLDVDVSRSALGRHVKSLAQVGEQIRRAETMAKFVVDKFGDQPDDQVGRANMRILQGALLEILTEEREDEEGKPVSLSAGEAKELALALQRLVASQRMDTERQLKLRRAVAEEAAKKAETAMKSRGMSADTIDFIRKEVLGVAGG
jgi:DNA-binding transcriptional ArsR family regulator